jgi:hypothetical protein
VFQWGIPRGGKGKEAKAAAAIFAEKVFESATIFHPGDQREKSDRDPDYDRDGMPAF